MSAATMHTNHGAIELELFDADAPKTVENFVKLSKDGFCTTWKGSPSNCYTIVNVDKNKWSVVKGAATVAVWSK